MYNAGVDAASRSRGCTCRATTTTSPAKPPPRLPIVAQMRNVPTSMSFLRTLPRAASSTKSLWQAETKKVVFSGIQPTGVPHLGNYFGALRHWANLQHEPNSTAIFSIVDMHAITVKQDPQSMKRRRKKMLASLLAVGLDPKKCIIFVQSSVKQHAELMWILSCSASMGYLGRMTQWKVCFS